MSEAALLIVDDDQSIRTVLRSFADSGGTVLVSSHLLAEVAQSVDRIIIIDGGRTVADAPLPDIVSDGQTLEDAYLALTTGGAS